MKKLVSILFILLCATLTPTVIEGSTFGKSISGRIVGGEVAAEAEFPWQVSLRVPGAHRCGGSLVSLQHVLTAAHCVAGLNVTELTIISGTNSLASGGESHRVRTVHTHALYQSPEPAYHINDVAIIVLEAPIIETPFQRPITLPIEDVPDDAEVVVSGWGRSLPESNSLPTDLQKLNLTILNQTECQNQWGDTIIRNDHLCGVTEYGYGICNGDSGGALVYNDQVVGIVSWASPCGFNYPDVYTRVYAHLYWIGWLVYNTDTETSASPEVTTQANNSGTSLMVINISLQISCGLAIVVRKFVLR